MNFVVIAEEKGLDLNDWLEEFIKSERNYEHGDTSRSPINDTNPSIHSQPPRPAKHTYTSPKEGRRQEGEKTILRAKNNSSIFFK